MVFHSSGDVQWCGFEAFDSMKWLIHGFTTRLGGVSGFPYTSLNMGLHVGDDEASVLENRRKAAKALCIEPEHLVAVEQIHGTTVSVVDNTHLGRGALTLVQPEGPLQGSDAIITAIPGVPLVSFYADCVPVFFADGKTGVVGLAHSGWKGTIGRISQKTIEAMASVFGANPRDIVVGIGPHIGSCCFEVSVNLVDDFRSEFYGDMVISSGKDGKGPTINLEACVVEQLLDAGCHTQNIHLSGLCTSCNTETFFSHRAESGKTGRMASFIQLTE